MLKTVIRLDLKKIIDTYIKYQDILERIIKMQECKYHKYPNLVGYFLYSFLKRFTNFN